MLAVSALVTSSSSAVKDDSIRISPCIAILPQLLWLQMWALLQAFCFTACVGPSLVRGSITHPQNAVQGPLYVFLALCNLPLRLQVRCGFEGGIEQQPASLQQTCSCLYRCLQPQACAEQATTHRTPIAHRHAALLPVQERLLHSTGQSLMT